MYILKRKRFALILCFLFLSFSSYFIAGKSNTPSSKERNYDITQVSSVPVTEKVIVIDAGHGRRRRSVLLILMVFLRLVLICKLH